MSCISRLSPQWLPCLFCWLDTAHTGREKDSLQCASFPNCVPNPLNCRSNLNRCGGVFDTDATERRLKEIEFQLGAPEAWSEPEKLTPVLKEKSLIEGELADFARLFAGHESVSDWLELAAEEESEEAMEQLAEAVASLAAMIEEAEMALLLGEEEDRHPAILEIHPGAGGTEAQDWAEMLLRMYLRWADRHACQTETLDFLAGEEAGVKSVTLRITGQNVFGLLKNERGIHRLIRISPFDSSGRRHTSFASIDVIPDVSDNIKIEVADADLRIDVFRASGAGGQHVNRTNSAVRITHMPSGIVVQCQNEKSQHQNKDSAMKILKARLYNLEFEKREAGKKAQYQEKEAINFGSQIRTYTMQPYRLVKDHRTGTEATDVDAVLDGNLDKFIMDNLLYAHANKTDKNA